MTVSSLTSPLIFLGLATKSGERWSTTIVFALGEVVLTALCKSLAFYEPMDPQRYQGCERVNGHQDRRCDR